MKVSDLDSKNMMVSGSFRDPSGFLFFRNGEIYRQVNVAYKEDYDLLMGSGLYEELVVSKLLIPHTEVDLSFASNDKAYKIIKPEMIPFVSYPYEWCFSQLRDAAITTLLIQKKALDFGMSLKDCSAYNVQFKEGKPTFIDTLSFEKYTEGEPWVAYRQFCQHFLGVLSLMCYADIRLSQLFKIFIDGVPLDLASKLLPFSSKFNLSLFSHIHAHAKSQEYFSGKAVRKKSRGVKRMALLGIIDNLETFIRKLKWSPKGTEWAEYYTDTNYTDESFQHKKNTVSEFINTINPETVWDLGANIGTFSRITSDKGIYTVSFDIDPAAVEKNYIESLNINETHILPLILDLTNPSPAIGWDHSERMSFIERGPVDAVVALALIHHLAISNNLPLGKAAVFFSRICRWLIIEFVPKEDSQVQRLLLSREDIFPEYTKEEFERQFESLFEIKKCVKVEGSERILYLMCNRSSS